MTKEEAFENLDALAKSINGELVDCPDVSNSIEDIYYEFERRTCKNCLFYKDNICCNGDNYLSAELVDEDFGCVLFERRENERN